MYDQLQYTKGMLAEKFRFHGHGSLKFVYSRGQVVRSKLFITKYTHNSRRKQPRIAVVVSKKVMKSAVKRNRIRRRLYELIRVEMPALVQQTDLVFIVISPDVLLASHTDLQAAVRRSLAQAGLYNKIKN